LLAPQQIAFKVRTPSAGVALLGHESVGADEEASQVGHDRIESIVEFNIADLFECVADAVPERTAVVCADERVTYAQLEAGANQIAHVLSDAGARAGEHVALYLPNSIEHLSAMLGCYKLRAVPINANTRYVDDELVYLFDDADAVAVIHDASN